MDSAAQVNAAGNWNPNGSWNPEKQRNAPWRDHPNVRWSDANPNQPVPLPNTYEGLPPQEQHTNWSGRNHNSQPPTNSNRSSSYVPPHQRHYQSHQGPQPNYHNNHGHQNNYQPNQGSHQNSHHQGPNSNQPTHYQNQPKSSKSLDELMGDLISSQQHLQNNVQSNNDVVHRMQDAQKEHKASLDMLTRQMSQLVTSLNEMRGNEGKIPASVRMPDKENVSQITLRSGKEYKGLRMKVVEEGESSGTSGNGDQLPRWTGRADGKNIDNIEELSRPFPCEAEHVLQEADSIPKEK